MGVGREVSFSCDCHKLYYCKYFDLVIKVTISFSSSVILCYCLTHYFFVKMFWVEGSLFIWICVVKSKSVGPAKMSAQYTGFLCVVIFMFCHPADSACVLDTLCSTTLHNAPLGNAISQLVVASSTTDLSDHHLTIWCALLFKYTVHFILKDCLVLF